MSEVLVIAVVAIVIVGPKDLPKLLRTVGKTISGVKRMAGDFQQQFNDAIEETDLGDLKDIKDIATGKGLNPLESIKDAASDVKNDFLKGLEDSDKKSEDADSTSLFPENETSKRLAKVDAKNEAAAVKTAKKATSKKVTAKKTVAKKAAVKKAVSKKAVASKKTKQITTKQSTTKPKTKSKAKSVTKRTIKSVKT